MKPLQYNNMPVELKTCHQWVAWQKKKEAAGVVSKIPIDPKEKTLTYARVSDPNTWGSYQQAILAKKAFDLDGIGFVLTSSAPYVFIDMDNCLDPKSRSLTAQAMRVVSRLKSYTEISPSQRGIHILVKTNQPIKNRKGSGIEIYSTGRFFTITGWHLKYTPKGIQSRRDELADLIKTYFPTPAVTTTDKKTPPETGFSDAEIIQRAKNADNGKKFQMLWNGRIHDYGSPSEADLALCQILCFWTGPNPDRIDQLFRQSKLYRKKWDKTHTSDGRTYGQMTIEKAIDTTTSYHKENKVTQGLLDMGLNIETYHASNKTYARIPVDDHNELWPIDSEQFAYWLRHEYYKANKKAPSPTELNNTINQLAAKALFESPKIEIYTRIAEYDGAVYLDLTNDTWEVVKITPEYWAVVSDPPVFFKRTPAMLPLPHPDKNGNIAKLYQLLNIPDSKTWFLIVAWLIGALRPTGPYPILLLQGPHGSAKSSLARMLKALIDPSKGSLRTTPKNEENLAISANNSLILSFDNLSSLKKWLSDALCRISTGGGFGTRKFYTNEGEVIFENMKPVILNGIEISAYAHDLIDRCLIINLPHINNKQRREEAEIWAKFKEHHPMILGGLCDAVSAAIRHQSTIKLNGYPRMADFAKWVSAATSALPFNQDEFLRYYENNRSEALIRSLEADPVATGVIALMKLTSHWEGTATDLLRKLEGDPKADYANALVPRNITKTTDWPKAPHALNRRIREAQTFLNQIGIEISFSRTADARLIDIKRK